MRMCVLNATQHMTKTQRSISPARLDAVVAGGGHIMTCAGFVNMPAEDEDWFCELC